MKTSLFQELPAVFYKVVTIFLKTLFADASRQA